MPPHQREVLAAFHAAGGHANGHHEDPGMDAGLVSEACGITVEQAQQALVGLADRGFLYNSVDDFHFRLA